MMPLGTAAPEFALEDTDGTTVRSTDFHGRSPLLVIFMCNHCPYVKHVADQLKSLADDYADKNLAVVAINSNDVEAHPEDGPTAMAQEKATRGYSFPYLFDGDQSVAIAYGAACTPDFFLFDVEGKLTYRGQLDDSRPKSDPPIPVTGVDLRRAIDATLGGRPPLGDQKPSIGCNIKWKPGHEPGYFDPKGSANV